MAMRSTEDQKQLQNCISNIGTSSGSVTRSQRSSSSPLCEQEQQLDQGFLTSVSFPSCVYSTDGNSILSQSTQERHLYSYSNDIQNNKSESATGKLKKENNIVHQSHYEQQQENLFTEKL